MLVRCPGGDAQKMVRNTGWHGFCLREVQTGIDFRKMDLKGSFESQVNIVDKLFDI